MRRLVVVAACLGALWCAPGAFAANWCGSGETNVDRPDAVTAQQVHAIVVLPVDAPDTFPDDANRLQNDVDSIDGWWAGQDPTRLPRWDLATFPGGSCLDISFVRLPDPAATYSFASGGQASNAFSRIGGYLSTHGFSNEYKDYLVYGDGFGSPSDIVCGTGEGDFDQGAGYAMVWLRTCQDDPPTPPSDAVAAHELLHALGGVPPGAPNACTPANDPLGEADTAHTCDSPTDILYPLDSGQPLAARTLDLNHDDYYGDVGGVWNLQQSVFMHTVGVAPVPLAVAMAGAGIVRSDVPGVDCTAGCTTQWDLGWHVTLTPTPTASTRFVRWTGDCSGSDVCALTLDAARSVTAVFGPRHVPVRVRVSGKGKVACVPRCSPAFPAGIALRLTAHAAKGWRFTGWKGGACTGKALVCRPTTDAAVTAHATFAKKPAAKKSKKRRATR